MHNLASNPADRGINQSTYLYLVLHNHGLFLRLLVVETRIIIMNNVNPLKCSGVRQLRFKVFDVIQV